MCCSGITSVDISKRVYGCSGKLIVAIWVLYYKYRCGVASEITAIERLEQHYSYTDAEAKLRLHMCCSK